MAVTLANLFTNLNTYFGDASTDRILDAERYQALTEATVWLLEELGNDHNLQTYEFNFYDTINYYKISSSVSDLLNSADLRRKQLDQNMTATPKSARDIAEAIGKDSQEFAWAIERKDGDTYIAVTLDSNKRAQVVSDFESLSAGGGTWEADTVSSDATNVQVDVNEYVEGGASLSFDIDVSQSGNNYAVVSNSSLNTLDLTANRDIGSWILEAYIPDNLTISSYTIYWGSDSSNYWSVTKTTDIDGEAFVDGWNTLKFDWQNATETGSPDVEAIEYMAIRVTYTGAQVDDTNFRLDNLRIVNPEKLTYHYVSWTVGSSSVGAPLTSYTAATDVPFYSGQYDQYRYAVAHKAASILFFSVRLRDEALIEEREALAAVKRFETIFPSSKIPESKSVKVAGINFNRGRRRR